MKKTYSILAVVAMAIIAIAMAFVSCKKENENALNNQTDSARTFDPRQVEDMSAYLQDFKLKMQSSTKDDETLSLEDAAWHLASLANYDFCKVNVEYDDVAFDTIEIQVNITDGEMMMRDLNTSYEQMCAIIQQFRKGFVHNNQNLFFINVTIDAVGNAKIAIMTSFNSVSKYIYDHTWYFYDEFTAMYECEDYFDCDSTYQWNTRAADLLENALNLFEHHENTIGEDGCVNICFTPTRSQNFDYSNTYDQYHSDFYGDSRVFAMRKNSDNWNFYLTFDQMCYCLDSYLGLGYDFVNNTLYPNEHPVCWVVYRGTYHNGSWYYYYHRLHVEYGQLVTHPSGPSVD